MAAALDTQQHAAQAHIQYVQLHAFAVHLQKVPAVLGLRGVLVLLTIQELAQELALLETLALQLKQSNAGTVQQALI